MPTQTLQCNRCQKTGEVDEDILYLAQGGTPRPEHRLNRSLEMGFYQDAKNELKAAGWVATPLEEIFCTSCYEEETNEMFSKMKEEKEEWAAKQTHQCANCGCKGSPPADLVGRAKEGELISAVRLYLINWFWNKDQLWCTSCCFRANHRSGDQVGLPTFDTFYKQVNDLVGHQDFLDLLPKTEAVCQRCKKTGSVPTTDMGFFINEQSVRDAGWYWSSEEECFYCLPCERALTKEIFSEIMKICKERKIPVQDLHGNEISLRK